MITPTTPANIYDFNNEVVSLPLVSLTVLARGVKLSLALGEDFNGTVKSARELLSAPEDYPVEFIEEHLSLCLENTKDFYGI